MIADSNIAIADVILAHMDGRQGIIAMFFPLTEVYAVKKRIWKKKTKFRKYL